MTQAGLVTVAVVLGWLVLATMQRRLQPRHRIRAFWALILIGIPVLGWLTLNGGPMAGVAGLAAGIAVLLRAPRRPARKRAAPPAE
ncbi:MULTISPECIES: DUF2484 family protein [Paracoccus]|uniref:DUF2484 family protein n=1 Tax=Paracoccus aerius TaxID=1915382 RepID=A0ABS1S705_9RHOB|nr:MULTISPECIES: DUF2484 family protein [Paracoccus]MBL3673477.1 DUF2484 family protein [Paracoccus aerius]QIR85424.1 DUF2484 family protein [Paracoccus sp. AK26]GHG19931.1 hypothetical protein GCM10017322_16340 [Paracoccus aerius]